MKSNNLKDKVELIVRAPLFFGGFIPVIGYAFMWLDNQVEKIFHQEK